MIQFNKRRVAEVGETNMNLLTLLSNSVTNEQAMLFMLLGGGLIIIIAVVIVAVVSAVTSAVAGEAEDKED
ncbi:MAG: hypothetical protein IKQ28_04975 [Lachnospiraceae bacterium]|nr:hypothetical protein [Lachnospiraceae bacterium]